MLELAILRNKLIDNIFSENERDLIESIRKLLKNFIRNPFNRLIENALKNCEEDVAKNDFKSAVQEIQVVHNFPLGNTDTSKWDENHFYRVELLSYLEQVDNVERIKKLIAELAKLQVVLHGEE